MLRFTIKYDFFLKIFYVFTFRERGKEGEREGEKHQCVVASPTLPTGDLAHNPGMCPNWESNRQPFGSQAGAQSTEPHQPRLNMSSNNNKVIFRIMMMEKSKNI